MGNVLGDVAVAQENGVYLGAQVGVERRGGVVGGRRGDLDWRRGRLRHVGWAVYYGKAIGTSSVGVPMGAELGVVLKSSGSRGRW